MSQQLIPNQTLILRVLGSLCLLTNLGCQYPRQTSGEMEQAKVYLKENVDILERDDKGFVISSILLDNVTDDYEVFLTGETHGIALNFDLRFDFLVYFYHKANVRYLLIEISPSQAAVKRLLHISVLCAVQVSWSRASHARVEQFGPAA